MGNSVTAARDNDFFNHDIFKRPVTTVAWDVGDGDDYFLAFYYFAEHAVFAVEPWGRLWVMKNWLPLVLGPALAMDKMPGLEWLAGRD